MSIARDIKRHARELQQGIENAERRRSLNSFGEMGRRECEWGRCENEATHVRFYATEIGSLGLMFTPSSRLLCPTHVREWRRTTTSGTPRIERLIVIAPHGDEHLALEAAFHVLARGLYTAAELGVMNSEAARRHKL